MINIKEYPKAVELRAAIDQAQAELSANGFSDGAYKALQDALQDLKEYKESIGSKE